MVFFTYSSKLLTFYNEKAQSFKNDLNPFLSFVLHNDRLQDHCWLSVKIMTRNFVVIVKVLVPSYCHMAHAIICALLLDIVGLLSAMTKK